MPVSDEVIVTRLRALLEEVDLQTTSGEFARVLLVCLFIFARRNIHTSLHAILFVESSITMIGYYLAERKLRETIEAELKEDLSERKALIRQEVRLPLLH